MDIRKSEVFFPTIFTHGMARRAESLAVNIRTRADMVGTAKKVQSRTCLFRVERQGIFSVHIGSRAN